MPNLRKTLVIPLVVIKITMKIFLLHCHVQQSTVKTGKSSTLPNKFEIITKMCYYGFRKLLHIQKVVAILIHNLSFRFNIHYSITKYKTKRQIGLLERRLHSKSPLICSQFAPQLVLILCSYLFLLSPIPDNFFSPSTFQFKPLPWQNKKVVKQNKRFLRAHTCPFALRPSSRSTWDGMNFFTCFFVSNKPFCDDGKDSSFHEKGVKWFLQRYK